MPVFLSITREGDKCDVRRYKKIDKKMVLTHHAEADIGTFDPMMLERFRVNPPERLMLK